MNVARPLLVGALLATGSAAWAQFVKGNEAITFSADGTAKVETPPLPANGASTPPRPCAATAGCHAGPWHMVETPSGLSECTEPFARATTCRKSTFGTQKLSRVWVVKRGDTWLWCQLPNLASKCVDMNAKPPMNLPSSAVQ